MGQKVKGLGKVGFNWSVDGCGAQRSEAASPKIYLGGLGMGGVSLTRKG